MFLLLLASTTKYMKQLVLINHSWISPKLQKSWSSAYSPEKKGGVHFPQKWEKWVKWRRKVSYCRENNLHLLLTFTTFINPRNIAIQGIYKREKF